MNLSTEFILIAREAENDLDNHIAELEKQKAEIEQELEDLYRIKDDQDLRDTQECALDRAIQ